MLLLTTRTPLIAIPNILDSGILVQALPLDRVRPTMRKGKSKKGRRLVAALKRQGHFGLRRPLHNNRIC